uniref:Uncharacterized protein n=1 Tax=Anguilla anguilla TaxID=7936 RepID=A0A0E9Y1Z5_ANGAN
MPAEQAVVTRSISSAPCFLW